MNSVVEVPSAELLSSPMKSALKLGVTPLTRDGFSRYSFSQYSPIFYKEDRNGIKY